MPYSVVPGNVILTADRPYLIDFGISRALDGEPAVSGLDGPASSGSPSAGAAPPCPHLVELLDVAEREGIVW
jgi:hypothetical protein